MQPIEPNWPKCYGKIKFTVQFRKNNPTNHIGKNCEEVLNFAFWGNPLGLKLGYWQVICVKFCVVRVLHLPQRVKRVNKFRVSFGAAKPSCNKRLPPRQVKGPRIAGTQGR
jgi:hypothetical protein